MLPSYRKRINSIDKKSTCDKTLLNLKSLCFVEL